MVSELEAVAEDNADKKLATVVKFTGELSDEYIEKIKALGEELDLKHTALTTSSDGGKFKVNEDAEVTVMHYKGKKVAYNFASKETLSDDDVKEIVKGASTVLE